MAIFLAGALALGVILGIAFATVLGAANQRLRKIHVRVMSGRTCIANLSLPLRAETYIVQASESPGSDPGRMIPAVVGGTRRSMGPVMPPARSLPPRVQAQAQHGQRRDG